MYILKTPALSVIFIQFNSRIELSKSKKEILEKDSGES